MSATIIQSPPYADVFGGQWSDLYTITAANNAYSQLDSGYHRYVNNNPTARLAMSTSYAQSDAIWMAFGHANAGFITFCSPPGGSSCTSVLGADSTVTNCASPNACLNQYSTSISRMRLMAFVGCDTANSTAGGKNLLTTAVTTDGVDSAIGWTDTIYFGGAFYAGETYGMYFPYYMAQGQTVAQANLSAINEIRNHSLGYAFGYDGFVVKNGGIKTHPAAYGS